MSAISLTPELTKQLIESSRDALVASMIATRKDDFDLVSPSQAAGLLNITPATLSKLSIPRYVLVPNKVVQYRLSDLRAYLASVREV